jgi:hypothetical protein
MDLATIKKKLDQVNGTNQKFLWEANTYSCKFFSSLPIKLIDEIDTELSLHATFLTELSYYRR